MDVSYAALFLAPGSARQLLVNQIIGIVGIALWATASAVMYYRLRSLKTGVVVWKLSSATD